MLEKIFSIIFIIFISFLPLVFWAYIFSYIDSSFLNKKRFLLGIFAWAISVLPFLYFEKITKITYFSFLDIFSFAKEITNFSSLIFFSFSLFSFLFLLFLFSFFIWFFMRIKGKIMIFSLKIFSFFFIFTLLISCLFYLFHLFFITFPNLNFLLDETIYFWTNIFQTFKLLIFYYFIIAIIEESAKYFHFLHSSIFSDRSLKELVLYGIFIALGFSFIENILYFINIFFATWFSSTLLTTYFFRSVFSIFLHILCSSIIVYSFAFCITKYQNFIFLKYIKRFLVALFLAVFLHSFFDIALSLWISFIIFLYFLGGYIYVSSIFYKEEKL